MKTSILAVFLAFTALPAVAQDLELTIRDHKFEPDMLEIPAGTKVKIVIHNADPEEEEFDSYDLRREVLIPGRGTATLYVGPLKPGT